MFFKRISLVLRAIHRRPTFITVASPILAYFGMNLLRMVTTSSVNNMGESAKPKSFPVKFTKEELKERLTPEQYHVTQERGTERAFTGEYYNNKEDGIYKCVVCGEDLFDSKQKYDSGCGWPSFYDNLDPNKVKKITDTSHGMMRTEVVCAKCGAHLGHIFDDGPKPTGVRYCMNSASLKFKKKAEKEVAGKEEL